MENSEHYYQKVFNGAGYLIGFAISVVSAIILFSISKNVVIAISSSVPIGTTMGIILEKRFQGEQKRISPRRSKILIGLLSFANKLPFIILIFSVQYL
ncbi:MAG: hypothetical protein K9H26_06825 [Prolixibacteraceae bacterium]|nr:hypothetical protein [Prolixibacteraceae bacterium]